MIGNTLNISGLVYQGIALMTSGYVRVTNLNRPSIYTIVPIGNFEDGTLQVGRYDAWFRTQQPNDTVVEENEVFGLSVFSTLNDAVNVVNQISASEQTEPLTYIQINAAYLSHNIQLVANTLPSLPQILAEDNVRYTNNRTVYWTWVAPGDSDGNPLHFQIAWSQTSDFPPPATMLYDTRNSLDRSLVSYQNTHGNWVDFPIAGLPVTGYGRKCRFRITMNTNGAFYWRVRATDGIG